VAYRPAQIVLLRRWAAPVFAPQYHSHHQEYKVAISLLIPLHETTLTPEVDKNRALHLFPKQAHVEKSHELDHRHVSMITPCSSIQILAVKMDQQPSPQQHIDVSFRGLFRHMLQLA
jgi:hypothetical protein